MIKNKNIPLNVNTNLIKRNQQKNKNWPQIKQKLNLPSFRIYLSKVGCSAVSLHYVPGDILAKSRPSKSQAKGMKYNLHASVLRGTLTRRKTNCSTPRWRSSSSRQGSCRSCRGTAAWNSGLALGGYCSH